MTSKPSSAGGAATPLDPGTLARHVEQAQSMPASDPRRAAASIAMFERLTDHWSLRADDREMLLGGIAKSTWSEWRQRPLLARIKSDTRERIANLLTIDLNAHSLFAPEFADRWVREPNAAFEGESPLSTMLRGKVEDIIAVRRYLEGIRTSSPRETARRRDAGRNNVAAVSLLPGDAVESDVGEALAAIRRAVEIYERLTLEQPSVYEKPLTSALTAYATCLAEAEDPRMEAVLRRLDKLALERADEEKPPPRRGA